MQVTGRVAFDGRLWVSHHRAQAVSAFDIDVEHDEAFAGQVNGMLGAGVPGALLLWTGTAVGDVGLRVVVHGSEPPVGDEWEDVVEAPFTPLGPELHVAGSMSDVVCSVPLDPGSYRARWSGRGIDEAYDLTVGEDDPLVDRFELALWPAAAASDAVLRRNSRRGSWQHLPLTPEGRAEMALRAWGGGPPIPGLTGREHGPWAAQLDRGLAEEILAAGPERQRDLGVWAVRLRVERSGGAGLPWVAAMLDDLEAGRPPAAADPTALAERLAAELGRRDDDPWRGLLGVLQFPPDPLDAALFGVVSACADRDEGRQARLLREARARLRAPR